MSPETAVTAGTFAVVLDGDTDAGCRLARQLIADGRRVAVVARHAHSAVRVLHGQSSDRVFVIACDVADKAQWSRMTQRVMSRFGRIDTIVRAEGAALRASA